MFEFIPDLGELTWLILALLFLQITLMSIGLWEWNKKKNLLGPYKIIWLMLIIFINSFGPIIFLIYSQKLNSLEDVIDPELDDWSE